MDEKLGRLTEAGQAGEEPPGEAGEERGRARRPLPPPDQDGVVVLPGDTILDYEEDEELDADDMSNGQEGCGRSKERITACRALREARKEALSEIAAIDDSRGWIGPRIARAHLARMRQRDERHLESCDNGGRSLEAANEVAAPGSREADGSST